MTTLLFFYLCYETLLNYYHTINDNLIYILCSVIGSAIIVVGLYVVLWGKSKEIKRLSKLAPSGSAIESNDALNTTNNTTLKNVSMAGTFLTSNEGNDLHIKYPRENQDEQETVEEV